MRRRWYQVRWVRAGAVALLAIAVAAAAAPFVVPMGQFRPVIAQVITATTGRDVQIGSLRLYVLPTLRVRAANVRLENPQGFPAGDALAVNSIDFGITLRDLLARRIHVTRVALSGVDLVVISGPGGRTNLDLPAGSRTAVAPSSGGPGASLLTLGGIGRVSVAHLSLTSETIDPRSGRAVPGFALTGLGARITSFDPSVPDWARKLQVVAALKGARLRIPGLAKPLQFQSGEITVKNGAAESTFAAVLDTLRMSGTVRVAALTPAPPRATFALNVPDLDVDRLERLVTHGTGGVAGTASGPQRLLAQGEVVVGRLAFSGFEATQVRGRLSVYTDRIHLDDYSLSAYGGTVEGAGAADYAAADLPVVVTVRARGLDLGRLVSTRSAPSRIVGRLNADARLTASLARAQGVALAGGGTFGVARLVVPPITMTQVSGRLSMAGPRIRADSYRFSAYGGVVEGTAALDYAAPGLPVTDTMRASGVDAGALVSAIAPGAQRITGALEGVFNLRTALGHDPVASLAGAGTFAVRDGSFPGLDLGTRLGGLAQVAQSLQLASPSGATHFRYFGGDLRIARERGTSNELRLDADALNATARGSFGFDSTLDYTGTSVLSTQASGGSLAGAALSLAGNLLSHGLPTTTGVRIPFSVRGRFDAPQFSLAGTPELLRGQPQSAPASQPAPQPQVPQLPQLPQLPGLPPNLVNPFH
ncbi:MAG TPA: AsmA family protein [bacterium]|nr:AsmA family protein [bacterium]